MKCLILKKRGFSGSRELGLPKPWLHLCLKDDPQRKDAISQYMACYCEGGTVFRDCYPALIRKEASGNDSASPCRSYVADRHFSRGPAAECFPSNPPHVCQKESRHMLSINQLLRVAPAKQHRGARTRDTKIPGYKLFRRRLCAPKRSVSSERESISTCQIVDLIEGWISHGRTHTHTHAQAS